MSFIQVAAIVSIAAKIGARPSRCAVWVHAQKPILASERELKHVEVTG